MVIRIALGLYHLLVAILLLPLALVMGLLSIPVILPGLVWLVLLGIRIIKNKRPVRGAILITASLLALVAGHLLWYGFYCLEAAARSAESGGGIMGSVGVIPIVMGGASLILSLSSFAAIRSKGVFPDL